MTQEEQKYDMSLTTTTADNNSNR